MYIYVLYIILYKEIIPTQNVSNIDTDFQMKLWKIYLK